jgi:Putative Flp pilus-assembly TadE/G-like
MSDSFLLNQLNLSNAQFFSKLFKSAKSCLYPKARTYVMWLLYTAQQGDHIVKIKASEKGQALIMIALTAIGLFAFAALAIDGSMAFSDERHAQNAADTSVLAAALANIRGKNWNDTVSTARVRATSNGYNNNGTTNIVEVYLCNDANATCIALPAGAKPEEYIQVRITSHVKTYFARIIGRNEVINRVEAVAHAVPGYRTSTFGGKALVSLNKDACPAFDYGGGATTTVTGSGIFVNSRCDGTGSYNASNQALNSSSNNTTLTVPCFSIVGGATARPSSLISSGGCASSTNNPAVFIPDPLSVYKKTNIPCGATATYDSTTLNPGSYSGAFPPGNQTTMNPGIYCLDAGNQGFSLSGGQTLTGDNILIYMKSGNVNWTSGGVHLSAMQGISADYDGLLLYLAEGNCSGVSITGNGTSRYVGTILAPCSLVKLAGGSSTGNQNVLENQIIADQIQLTGSNSLNINYNAQQQWQPPVPPSIEINQ